MMILGAGAFLAAAAILGETDTGRVAVVVFAALAMLRAGSAS